MDRHDILVIGGGMAGLSAALYGAWLGRSVFLAERQMFGGQIVNADKIENYPGLGEGIFGADLASQLRMQALKFGAKMAYTEITRIGRQGKSFCVESTEEQYAVDAVIFAAGGRPRRLAIPGETEFEGKGVSRCATCDGAFFAGMPVAVIGGGDTALDEALYLAGVASSVTVIHETQRPTASATLVKRAEENPVVNFRASCRPTEIFGDDAVNAVGLSDGAKLPVRGVFIAVGFEPEATLLQGVADLDSGGHARVDLNMQTNVPGLFAVGAARAGNVGQLASAVGDGVTAAVAAHRYLQGR